MSMNSVYIVKIYKKHRHRCLAEVECDKEDAIEFNKQLNDDSITMLSIGYLRIPRERIDYVTIKERRESHDR